MIKIYNRNEISIQEILERSEQTVDVEGIVSDIIKNVKEYGDKALVEYCKKFDGAVDDIIEVTEEEIMMMVDAGKETGVFEESQKEKLVFISEEYLMPYLLYFKENRKIFLTVFENGKLFGFEETYEKLFNNIFLSPVG